MKITFVPKAEADKLGLVLRNRVLFSQDKENIYLGMKPMNVGDVVMIELEGFDTLSSVDQNKIVARLRNYVGYAAHSLDWPKLPNGRMAYETGVYTDASGLKHLWVRRKPGVNPDGTTSSNW